MPFVFLVAQLSVFIDSTFILPIFLRLRGTRVKSLANTHLYDFYMFDPPMFSFQGTLVVHGANCLSGHAARPGQGSAAPNLVLSNVVLGHNTVISRGALPLRGW